MQILKEWLNGLLDARKYVVQMQINASAVFVQLYRSTEIVQAGCRFFATKNCRFSSKDPSICLWRCCIPYLFIYIIILLMFPWCLNASHGVAFCVYGQNCLAALFLDIQLQSRHIVMLSAE